MSPMQEIARLLLNTGVDLYIFVLWLRFLLQAMNADFYNPVSQFVVHATSRLVDPLDRLFQRPPPAGVINMRRYRPNRWSFGALLLIVLIKLLQISLLGMLLHGGQPPALVTGFIALFNFPPHAGLLMAVKGLLPMVLSFYFWAILAGVILSWVAPQSPVVQLVFQITEPILAPCRRLLPAMGGFDLSPILAFVGLNIAEILLRSGVVALARLIGL